MIGKIEQPSPDCLKTAKNQSNVFGYWSLQLELILEKSRMPKYVLLHNMIKNNNKRNFKSHGASSCDN